MELRANRLENGVDVGADLRKQRRHAQLDAQWRIDSAGAAVLEQKRIIGAETDGDQPGVGTRLEKCGCEREPGVRVGDVQLRRGAERPAAIVRTGGGDEARGRLSRTGGVDAVELQSRARVRGVPDEVVRAAPLTDLITRVNYTTSVNRPTVPKVRRRSPGRCHPDRRASSSSCSPVRYESTVLPR